MLKVAILETEDIAKDIMFELASLLQNQEWSFQYFTKISQLASVEQKKEFQIIVFHEKFEVPRITQSFVLNKPQRIVIYTKEQVTEIEKQILPFSRIFYIDRTRIKNEIHRIVPYMKLLLKNQEEYLFSYNNIEVPLKISDIYYIEKMDKYLVYHTKRGEFRERKNMREASVYFKKYRFLWIHASYLVNMQYITQIQSNVVFFNKQQLPISRSKKAEIIEEIRKNTK